MQLHVYGCGSAVNNTPDVKKDKKPVGKGIAAMVLGIIAVLWALLMLIGTPEAMRDLNPNEELSFRIGYYVGSLLIQSICAIIAASLAAAERMKSKNGFNVAGLWLSISAFVLILITIMLMIAY